MEKLQNQTDLLDNGLIYSNKSKIAETKKRRTDFFKDTKSAVKTFLLASSVHGYPNIFRSSRLVVQVVWAIFTTVSLIICAS